MICETSWYVRNERRYVIPLPGSMWSMKHRTTFLTVHNNTLNVIERNQLVTVISTPCQFSPDRTTIEGCLNRNSPVNRYLIFTDGTLGVIYMCPDEASRWMAKVI